MKNLTLILAVLVCVIFSSQAQTNKVVERFEVTPKKKIKVTILGTTHFSNPGQDVVNMKVEDVLQPKRQKEMQALVDLLAKFKPTKIMLESTPKYDSIHNARYQQYLRGKHTLRRNERQQIGYRLAKQLGHQKIYMVDHRGQFPMGKVNKYAQANNQSYLLNKALGWAKNEMKNREAYFKNHTITEFLIDMNRPAFIKKSNGLYLSLFAKIGKDQAYPGTDLVANWYERNLKIYTNILRLAEDGDRILVVFGAGHAPILQHLFRDALDFEYIEVNDFLDTKTKKNK